MSADSTYPTQPDWKIKTRVSIITVTKIEKPTTPLGGNVRKKKKKSHRSTDEERVGSGPKKRPVSSISRIGSSENGRLTTDRQRPVASSAKPSRSEMKHEVTTDLDT